MFPKIKMLMDFISVSTIAVMGLTLIFSVIDFTGLSHGSIIAFGIFSTYSRLILVVIFGLIPIMIY